MLEMTKKMKARRASERNYPNGDLGDVSEEGVRRVPKQAHACGSRGNKKDDNGVQQRNFPGKREEQANKKEEQPENCGQNVQPSRDVDAFLEDKMNDSDWEECPILKADSVAHPSNDARKDLTIEFEAAPNDSKVSKRTHRASAEDKELAELVHKVHLLCLLARGKIVDGACDDPLLQASLLSLLPSYLSKISNLRKVTVKELSPIIRWFCGVFRVRTSPSAKRSFSSALASALESREGTPEELAALSVALLRALNLTTRFVSVLDVASIKPGAEKNENLRQSNNGIFGSSTLMVVSNKDQEEVSIADNRCSTSNHLEFGHSSLDHKIENRTVDSVPSKACGETSEACTSRSSQVSKRKGDLEFEMQLAMALSATSVAIPKNNTGLDNGSTLDASSSLKKTEKVRGLESSASRQGISTAVGSKKVGSPLYWAEVFCSGENAEGKWVHFDAVNGIIDSEQTLEAAADACKTSLRYVVAFAGGGAKDVTRRYCMKWHKIAPKRVNSLWWDAVLAPLRLLEAAATGGPVQLGNHPVNATNEHEEEVRRGLDCASGSSSTGQTNKSFVSEVSAPFITTRSSLEDMELATRALTEPLPTNQQAYKNHELYAIERWLHKNQILYPKGPVLGFCSGHPVYLRTCVQTLRTKERWLREGLQVKANELPMKVLRRSAKFKKVTQFKDDDFGKDDSQQTVELYGRWQLEPLCLPHAVDGIVPKNERGQVDVWSEKCLPPGTVHIRLPRIFRVAKRLGIDYAPAMVGFEFKNRCATPVFDGIVVCAEFKDAILEAYAEEEERRVAEEKRRNEAQAASRWYQLLSSIIIRERLKKRYEEGYSSRASTNAQTTNEAQACSDQDKLVSTAERQQGQKRRRKKDLQRDKQFDISKYQTENHEHVFEEESFDEETSVRTKRCRCGFSVQVEEL